MKTLNRFLLILMINTAIIFSMPSYNDVLLVINSASANSMEAGSYFKQKRNIPDANVCYVSLPVKKLAEELSITDKQNVLASISNHLVINNLTNTVNYIVLSYEFPGFCDHDVGDNIQIFTYYLMFGLADPGVDIYSFNEYFYYRTNNFNNLHDYKFSRKKYGFYIVSQLDGSGLFTVKKMIDNTGYTAYQSAELPVKYVHTKTVDVVAQYKTEMTTRGNITIDWKNGADIHACSINDISFLSLDTVNASGGEHVWPWIYRHFNFNPGALAMNFQSFPNQIYDRIYGGLSSYNGLSFTDYARADGADLSYKHMTSVAYDPVNDYIFCATGESLLYKGPGGTTTDNRLRWDSMGNGVAVYSRAGGNLVGHYNDNNGILSKRVTRVVYDPYHKRVWAATYNGVQYYDCLTHSWSSAIAELSCQYAAVNDIYIDPYNTNKIYVSYFYSYAADVGTAMPDGKRYVFEYDKNSHSLVKYPVFSADSQFPWITKTSIDTLWAVYAKKVVKYNLAASSVLWEANLVDLDPLHSADSEIEYPSAFISQTNSLGETNIFIAMKENITAGNCYLLKLTETGSAACTTNFISNQYLDFSVLVPGGNDTDYWIMGMSINPANSDELYLALTYRESNPKKTGIIIKSTDSAGTNFIIVSTNYLHNLRGIDVKADGTVFAVRGIDTHKQQCISDFLHFGAAATGGGMSHSSMYYNGSLAVHRSAGRDSELVSGYTGLPYYTSYLNGSCTQVPAMMFPYLDGMYMAEARFGVFKQYPATGASGYEGHITIFDPKCAPYAPRVDINNTVFNLGATNTISVKIHSPGLPAVMDSFFTNTINASTVSLSNAVQGQIAPAAISFISNTREIQFQKAGDFADGIYSLTLKCGIDGIKNTKGASLVNTRENEFLDSITLEYTVQGSYASDANLDNFAFSGIPENTARYKTNVITIIARNAANLSNYLPRFEGYVEIASVPSGGFTPFTVKFESSNNNMLDVPVIFNTVSFTNYKIRASALYETKTNESAAISVYLYNYDHFTAADRTEVFSGSNFNFTVSVTGPDGQTNGVAPYTGTVSFSGDLPSGCPADYTFQAADNNKKTFSNNSYSLLNGKKLIISGTGLSPVTNNYWVCGLAAQLKMNEKSGTTAYDSSGNDLNAVFESAPVWTNGTNMGGIWFDGIDDHLNMGTSESLRLSNKNFTVSMWVKMNPGVTDYRRLFGQQNGNGIWRVMWVGNAYYFQVRSDTVDTDNFSTYKIAITPDTWQFIAFTIDQNSVAGQMSVISYSNDIKIGTQSASFTGTYNYNDPVKVWANPDVPGAVDDVRIYNYALSQTEILAVYNDITNRPPLPSVSISSPLPDSWITNTNLSFSGSSANAAGTVLFSTNGTDYTPAGGLAVWTTNNFSALPHENKTNIFYAKATNQYGEEAIYCQTNYFDFTPPDAVFSSVWENSAVCGITNISGTLYDSFAPVTWARLCISNSTTNTVYAVSAAQSNWTNFINTELFPPGFYTVTLDASNAAGLEKHLQQTNIRFTSEQGEILLSAPVSGSLLSGITAIYGTIKTGISEPSGAFMKTNNSSPWSQVTLTGGTNWSTNFNTAALADGTYTFYFMYVMSNNTTNTNLTAGFSIDNTAPVLISSAPSNSQTGVSKSSAVLLFFSEAMNSSITNSLVISNTNGTIAGTWSLLSASNALFTPSGNLGNSMENIYAHIPGTAQDLAGNTITAVNIIFSLTDNTAPDITLVSPADNTFLNSAGTIQGTAADSESNLQKVIFSWNNWLTTHEAEGREAWKIPAQSLPEGTNRLLIRAVDDFGIYSPPAVITVCADFTPPDVNLPAKITTNAYFEYATNIIITISDLNLDNYSYSLNGSEYNTVTDSSQLNLSFKKSGVYTYNIRARDKAGNESKKGISFTFDISLVNLDGLSDLARLWAKKINDEDLAHQISSIKSRENGIPVIEYLVKQTSGRGAAATIVSKHDDNVLIVCKHHNGATEEKPKKVTVYDRSGVIIRQLDPANMRDTVVVWDKKDRSGRPVNDGIYFLIVEYQGTRSSIPVVVMKKIR